MKKPSFTIIIVVSRVKSVFIFGEDNIYIIQYLEVLLWHLI